MLGRMSAQDKICSDIKQNGTEIYKIVVLGQNGNRIKLLGKFQLYNRYFILC